MTFGEKIQKLRREAGLSQESFAEQLGVSRQAVSKSETDRGYPETEKMIRISKLFHVTLDYLLDDENAPAEGLEKNSGGMKPEEVRKCERSSGGESFGGECSAGPMDAGRRQGLYISRGTAEAFLLFQRAKWKKTGGAAGIFIAGLSFSFWNAEFAMLLFAVCLTASIVLSASVWLAGDPYRKMWKQPLIFDERVKRQVTLSYAQQQKKAHLANLTGIVLISTGLLLMPLLAPGAGASIDDLLLAAGMVLAGIGIFLCIYLTGILRAYRLLVMNEIYRKEKIK